MMLTGQSTLPVNYNANEVIEEMSDESSIYNYSPMKQGGLRFKSPKKMPVKPYL